MKRQLTEEQKQKSEARRAKFRALAKQIGAMTDEARTVLASRMGALVTVEGRAISLKNTCLIAIQKPDATLIGGFRQWLKAGRCVRKGETGLMIWIPAGKRDRDTDTAPAADAQAGEDSEGPSFIVGTVFDVSQTIELETAPTEDTTAAAAELIPQPQPQFALVLA